MAELEMSRKDFNGLRAKNYFEKKQRTELKNIEASKLIIAAKQLKREQEQGIFNTDLVQQARASIKAREPQNDDMIKILEGRITEMDRRIALFEAKQEEGSLKRGEKQRMEIYINERLKLIEQKNDYLQKSKVVKEE